MVISSAVEGIVDEAIIRRLIDHVSGEQGAVYGKAGKRPLLDRLAGYNQAAEHAPWAVLLISTRTTPAPLTLCKRGYPPRPT